VKRRHRLVLGLPVLLIFFGGTGHAATAEGMASATVVRPVSVRQLADLDFGVILAGSEAAGEVELAPAATGAVYAGGARRGCAGLADCPRPHAASFEVTGESGRAYMITAPDSVTVTAEAAGAGSGGQFAEPLPLRVNALRLRSASRPEAGPAGKLDGAGTDRFDLGGTLHVPAGSPPARYRVDVPVIVSYS
jgi:Domain of unknown function (DUF4402)